MKLIIFAALALFNSNFIFSDEIVWRSPSGDLSIIEVQPEDSLHEVVNIIRNQMEIDELEKHQDKNYMASHENKGDFLIDFMTVSNTKGKEALKGPARDFNAKLTANEIKDIDYIIGTLGMSS